MKILNRLLAVNNTIDYHPFIQHYHPSIRNQVRRNICLIANLYQNENGITAKGSLSTSNNKSWQQNVLNITAEVYFVLFSLDPFLFLPYDLKLLFMAIVIATAKWQQFNYSVYIDVHTCKFVQIARLLRFSRFIYFFIAIDILVISICVRGT